MKNYNIFWIRIMGNILNCCKSNRGTDDILDEDLNTLRPGDARLKLERDEKTGKLLDPNNEEGGEENGRKPPS